jgi:hypothetical protein
MGIPIEEAVSANHFKISINMRAVIDHRVMLGRIDQSNQ